MGKRVKIEIIVELITILAVLCLLIYKYPSPFMYKLIWTEDGNIFVEGAQNGFLHSLITPHNGYLQTIQRLFAGFALLFDFKYLPIIYLSASILSLCALIHIIFTFLDVKLWKKVLISALIVSVSPNCVIFSNLCNIHWILVTILMIFIASDFIVSGKVNKTIIGISTLFIGLSGPFSVILLPVLFLRIFVKKDFRKYIFFYVPFLISSFIQSYFLLTTPRISNDFPGLYNSSHYLKNCLNIIFNSSPSTIISCIIVLLLLTLLIRNLYLNPKKSYIATSLILCGILITGSALLLRESTIFYPTNGTQCIYTYNLYFCIFSSIIILLNDKHILLGIILVSFLFLGFKRIEYPDINWNSNILLYKVIPDTVIKINPVNWVVHIKNMNSKNYKKPNYTIDLKTQNYPVTFNADSRKICPSSSDIGFVINSLDIKNSADRLFILYSNHKTVEEIKPFLVKNIYKYFSAFPITDNSSNFSIFFPKEIKHVSYEINVYCLGVK